MNDKEILDLSKTCKEYLKHMGLTISQVQKLYDKNDVCPFCNDYEWYGSQVVYHLNAYPDTCLKKFKKSLKQKRKRENEKVNL